MDGAGKVIGGYKDVNLGWVVRVFLDQKPKGENLRTFSFVERVLELEEPSEQSSIELGFHKEGVIEEPEEYDELQKEPTAIGEY